MAKPSLIASLITPPSANGAELTSLPASVDWLEVRADLIGDIDTDWLRSHFPGRLLYVLRSTAEGGSCTEGPSQRQQRLVQAARSYDRIEIEGFSDQLGEVLHEIPIDKRMIAWHGATNDLAEVKARFAHLSSIPASLYKLVTRVTGMQAELNPLLLLKSLSASGRTDTLAYAEGPMGFWSRVAALHLGAPAIFGSLPNNAGPAEVPTITQLISDYGLPDLTPVTELFAIIGDPIFHSLSPRLHNAAYRVLDCHALFVPLRVNSFSEFWRDIVQSRALDSLGWPINGMTVASPHKEAALLAAGKISPMARQAESANVLVRNNGSWKADTTDPEVIYTAGRDFSVRINDKRAAVIGCGGAGRAIAAALLQSGAGVTLINRGAERGSHAAKLLGLPYIPLPDFDAEGYDIVVNATPVGRDDDEIPFKLERLNSDAVVIDLVYGSRPTPLVGGTLAREQLAIDGRDVLVSQVLQQFRLMTKKEMPSFIASEMLGGTASANRIVGSLPSLFRSQAKVMGTDAS